MDQHWLERLDRDTAIIVPTRSLASRLSEQIAELYLAQGNHVWEAPNILIWQDYLTILWQLNRDQISKETGAQTLISANQSSLLWTQIIEKSRRAEQELLLLNVQQTARAVQRSRRLMVDWMLTSEQISSDHVADTEQLLLWVDAYHDVLSSRALIDQPLLQQTLNRLEIKRPFKKLIWYCFDLITDIQRQSNQLAEQAGTEVLFEHFETQAIVQAKQHVFTDHQQELRAIFQDAKRRIELAPLERINVVIPDLQYRHAQVKEMARQVFYPSLSPLQTQRIDTVYRFSLGQPLKEWAAIETALATLGMLKNLSSTVELSFLFRNQFLITNRKLAAECRSFERWLKRHRYSQVNFDSLPELYTRCIDSGARLDSVPESSQLANKLAELIEYRRELHSLLTERKNNNGFSALSFIEWVDVFTQWLALWGWKPVNHNDSMHSVEFQLNKRWQGLLEEFAALGMVQKQVGLSRALEVLTQMTRDTVFLPRAANSPILISGLYEAIGQPAKVCFLTGMDQSYPPAPKPDAFLPQRLFSSSGFPDRDAESSFEQAKQVTQSVLNSAPEIVISYAQINSNHDEFSQPSPIYRNREFDFVEFDIPLPKELALEQYEDIQGPAWVDPKLVRGGARIFENQSQCEFKAFVTHQLEFETFEESEFGMDALDRGSILHSMLDRLWAMIGSQKALKELGEEQRTNIISQCIEDVYIEQQEQLSEEKASLLRLERERHSLILNRWLLIEEKRIQNFSVVEREERRKTEIGGIPFTYVIDRLDMTDDGRTVIIDYKTGNVARSEWLGERVKSPQMPLYSLALDQYKRKPVSGIAFAQIGVDGQYQELAETGIFRDGHYATKYEQNWLASRDKWPALFEQLAHDFLAGKAQVNPIDEIVCRYCELSSLCRVEQLRKDAEYASGGKHD